MTFKSLNFAKTIIYWLFKRLFSMTIGEHIMLLRKQKGISQTVLGNKIGTSGDVVGRYERNVITPSIDVIIKIADSLEVSIDYLVGKTSLMLDNQILKRIEQLEKLPEDKKIYIFDLIDMCIRDFKNKEAYA